MPSPPSYKTTSSQENLAMVTQNLTADEKKNFLAEPSIHTVASVDDASTLYSTNTFNPTTTLNIVARGMGVIRFPVPSSEMEINIYSADGTLAYQSIRHKRSSGNAVLSSPGRGELVASYYRFGPGKPPTLQVLSLPEGKGEVTTAGKWTSRTQEFTLEAVPVKFDWRYRRERVAVKNQEAVTDEKPKEPKTTKRTFLVLEVPGADKKTFTRIAQLVRDEETRTPGTKSCTAGNGGALVIDSNAAKAVGIPEELIVSSCIMMLKKEMDRRRAMQIMIIAGAAGS